MPLYDYKLLHLDTSMTWIGIVRLERPLPHPPIYQIAPSSEGHIHDR